MPVLRMHVCLLRVFGHCISPNVKPLPLTCHTTAIIPTRETSTRRSGRRQMQIVEPEHLIVNGPGGGSRHPKCYLSILESPTLLP